MRETNIGAIFRVSVIQEDLFLLAPTEGALVATCDQARCSLKGDVAVATCKAAWEKVVERHDLLRASFVWEKVPQPVQILHQDVALDFIYQDMNGLPTDGGQAKLEELARAQLANGIHPRRAPLFRICLVRLSEEKYELIFTYHRLILDRESAERALTEWRKHYNGESPNQDATGGLVDYVRKYGQISAGGVQSQWRAYLHDVRKTTLLPQSRINATKGSTIPSVHRSKLCPETARAIHDLACVNDVSVVDFVYAAWAILLSRYTGSSDVLFGQTRSLEKVHPPTLAPYTHMSPQRVRIDAGQSVVSLIRALHEEAGRMHDAELEPLAKILGWAGLDEFDTVFGSSISVSRVSSCGLGRENGRLVVERQIFNRSTSTPLALEVVVAPDEIVVETSYDSSFDPAAIERIVDHFSRLMRGMASCAEAEIRTLQMSSEAELHQAVVEWNRTNPNEPEERSIAEIFEAQAQQSPKAVALALGSEKLTYEALNLRANQLARYLIKLGVSQQTSVAVCMERSLEMIVGLLGIVKAGASYVPLDPFDPPGRIAYMMGQTQSPVLLTQRRLDEKLPPHWGYRISLDSEWPVIALEDDENLALSVSPEALAYVMFTSGSTGEPKGVAIPQRGIVRLVRDSDFICFGTTEIFLQHSPYSFDASTFEIWGALLNGAKLVIMAPGVPSLSEICDVLEAAKVTTLWLTAGLFHSMVVDQLPRLSGLRHLIAGGDRLSPNHVQSAIKGLPSTRIVNGYGPTEATTFACCCQLSTLPEEVRDSVPIGRPISRTQAYILDSELRPLPIGSTGELFIGGNGLAQGYLQDAQLTAAKFIPDPFARAPGARLYKTGDLAYYLSDGAIQFVGRTDGQVKIRGFRIEVSEVEAAIRQCSHVRDVVVVAFGEQTGKKLGACVVTEGQTLSEAGLQEYLRVLIPPYMVPSRVIFLAAFPLTTRGKVDRAALEVLFSEAPHPATFASPESPLEILLAGIYCEALGLEKIGVSDNFFSMGGDSMRSIQIISLAEKMRLKISVSEVFEYQTIRELAAVVEGRGARAELCGVDTAKSTFALITVEDRGRLPKDIEDAYPLTRLQAGMVFHSELKPESALYLDVLTFDLEAVYEGFVLERAFRQIVSRHEILRTSFDMTSCREPVQLVHREAVVTLTTEDLRDMAPMEQDVVIDEFFHAEKKKPFDWRQAPLMRAHVHRRSEHSFQLTLSFHHAILDGWSVASLLTELFQRYLSMLEGRDPDPEDKPITRFCDLVKAEKMALQSEDSKQFWISMLADLQSAPVASWPADQERANGDDHSVIEVPITAQLSSALSSLAVSAQIPLKSVLFAAHLRVLSLLSGSNDVVTGFVTHGRPESADSDQVLGLFLNALPFRMKLNGGTWSHLVKEVFRIEREIAVHRWYPLAQIQNDLGGQQLYDTAFTFTHFHVQKALQGISQIGVVGSREFTKANIPFAPFFHQEIASSQLSLSLDYDAAEFPKSQIVMIGDYYIRALEAMTADPYARYEADSLMPLQQQEMLRSWNSNRTPVNSVHTIHELFEAQARETPGSTAALYNGESITFQELSQKSDQMAHLLVLIGVGPETVVGISLSHSIQMLTALLGILKAGAAFVAIDPGYPLQRKAFMIDDAQLPVIVTNSVHKDKLPAFWGQIISLDEDAIGDLADIALPSCFSEQAAYLVYTSGSAGQPKAVVVSHRSLINNVLAMVGLAGIVPEDRLLQFVSLSFDAAVQQVFMTLVGGACLVLADGVTQLSPIELLDLCERFGVNTLYLPPSYWHELVRELADTGRKVPKWLRQLLTGGETPSVERLRVWASLDGNGVPFLNAYGPAEATVTATAFAIRPDLKMLETWNRVPIGKPLPNVQAFVLDEDLQQLPLGAVGELFLGGVGLARGYLSRSELTAESFLPNPFSGENGGRLYRTGDMARLLPDGNLEFWGRKDEQIKINGYRIEPAEVERALLRHSMIGSCVVVKHERETATPLLVAYIVPKNEEFVAPEELTAYLRESLPEYMVPKSFFAVKVIPLTTNGKVDRRSLKTIAAESAPARIVKSPPRNAIEEILRNIWIDVLATETIGIHDNFFDIGGHSLLATQVVSRVREILQVDMPLKALFDTPTIAQLAESKDSFAAARTETIPRASREEKLPLSHGQRRLWFLNQLQPGNPLFNVPVVLAMKGRLDIDSLERSFTEIVRRHEVLRTVFSEREGEPSQTILPATAFHIPRLDLQRTDAISRSEEVRRLCQDEAQGPFDLRRGLLLRASLLCLAEEDHLLMLTMHHIAADEWSTSVVAEELTEFYSAFVAGRDPALPELAIQYADFAVWQRQRLSGEVFDQQLAYWTKQLRDAPQTLELPTDHPYPVARSFRGRTESLPLSAELSRSIRQVARRYGATEFMVLLSTFVILLHRYSGMEDIVVGTDIANRNIGSTERLVGFFVNQLVLRNDLSDNPTFVEVLQRVRRTSLDAYANQDLPFEKLVEALRPERRLRHAPIFQAKFIFHNASRAAVRLPGLSFSFVESPTAVARYDLTLSFEHADDGLTGFLEYDADLFEPSTAERMVGHLRSLLESIVTSPDRPVSALSLLSKQQEQRIIGDSRGNVVEFPVRHCIHTLFEQQAARDPLAVALQWGDHRLTYGEVNERSNQLAHHLRKCAIGPEDVVGICLDRSPDLIIAILGTLKAGAAYLPLDPDYPVDRLVRMVEDARPAVLLTEEKHRTTLSEVTVSKIALDDCDTLRREHSDNLDLSLNPEMLAYVIYTSGSTGTPKGCRVTHGNVVRLFHATDDWYRFGQNDVWTLFHSYAFDFSVWEIWGALLHGGKLIVVPSQVSRSPSEFYRLLCSEGVTVLNQTPSAFLQLIALEELEGSSEALALRLVIFGGEALDLHDLKPWFRRHGDQHPLLVNMYGITETTVHVTYRPLSLSDFDQGSVIGIPIPDMQIYLADSGMELVPAGIIGEIYVGGAGVGQGYLGRGDLTAERFVPDPFGGVPGARLYKSGDSARYLTNGELAYVGRLDHQVKIRGYRVELGEVEASLRQHPQVRQAAVLMSTNDASKKRMQAYIVTRDEGVPTSKSLKVWLGERVPRYMVPTDILFVERMPVLPNGKLDRKELARLGALQKAPERPLLLPQTRLENVVVDTWKAVLKLDQVGLDENFFDLGGHSLLILELRALLQAELDMDIVATDLFEYPTVRAFAEHLAGLTDFVPSVTASQERGVQQREAHQRMKRARQRTYN
jgi:amino acid adenylation domain-containing protein